MRGRFLALAIALAAPSAAWGQSSSQSQHRTVDAQLLSKVKDANLLLKKAWTAFEKKDLSAAREKAAESVAMVPELPEAHLLLAKVAYLEKDFPKALAEIESAEAGWESLAALRDRMDEDRLRDVRKRIGEKDDALSGLRAQLAKTPPESQGALQTKISRTESEKVDLERLLTEAGTARAEVPAEYDYIHGNALVQTKDPAAAVGRYESALRKKPGYTEAANNLAIILFSAKRYAKAKEVLDRAEAAGASPNAELKKAVEAALAKPM